MIPQGDLVDFLDGARPDLEAVVANDPEALPVAVRQRQLAAALRVTLGGDAGLLRQSILSVVAGASPAEMKSRVLAAAPQRRSRARWWWWGLLAATAGAMTGYWLSSSSETPRREDVAPATVVATNRPVIRPTIPARRPAKKVPERDWMRQPFADSSPWNQRLPVGVRSASCGLTGTVAVAHPDLMVPVYVGEPGKFPWAFRPVVLVLESNRVFELRGVVAGDGLEAVRVWTNDLRGTGICAEGLCGPRRSGMSALGGLIRVGEARDGIKHALAITVPVSALARPGWMWPASAAFGLRPEDLAESGHLHLGSRVMLPAELGELGPVGRALQEFGAFVVDAHTNADFTVGIFVEQGVADELTAGDDQWLPGLRVVE